MTNNFPKVMTYTKPQAQEAQRRPRSIKKVHLDIVYAIGSELKHRKYLKKGKPKKNKYKKYSAFLLENIIFKVFKENKQTWDSISSEIIFQK